MSGFFTKKFKIFPDFFSVSSVALITSVAGVSLFFQKFRLASFSLFLLKSSGGSFPPEPQFMFPIIFIIKK
ncbi:MAG: hypothetical protein LBD88_03615 [Candidatus Peribacteria bacterium]|jgi:hypothetical protein|nr:hypothetical protein [Candidatus Peribacteria bacterium]